VLPALSLSSSFTQVGAIVAFAVLLGIALLSMLIFTQARELKRLREWTEREPERVAELEQRISAAVALRIKRASAQLARPATPAKAVVAATKVVPALPAPRWLPAAPLLIGGARPPQTAPPQPAEPPIVPAEQPAERPAEQPAPSERVPQLAGVAVAEAPAAVPVETPPPRAPTPPPPAPSPREDRGAGDDGGEASRRAPRPESGRAPMVPPARRTSPPLSGGRSQPPRRPARRIGARPPGPPPGPPFLREERSPARARALLAAGAIVGVVVLVVVLNSLGGSSSGGKHAAFPPAVSTPVSETRSETTRTSTHRSESATSPAETRVVVLNGTETQGLAHRLSSNLQQSGYSLANALAGRPSGSHSATVVEYAAGHRVDAEHVAQTLGVSDVAPLDAATAAMTGSATVVVIAGADQASIP
jgi:hypothetical protein